PLSAAAAQGGQGLLTGESIVARQRVFKEQHVGGAKVELVVRSQVPAGFSGAVRSGGRRYLSRSRLKQRPRPGPILSNQADNGRIRRICGKGLEWRQGHLFKSYGH